MKNSFKSLMTFATWNGVCHNWRSLFRYNLRLKNGQKTYLLSINYIIYLHKLYQVQIQIACFGRVFWNLPRSGRPVRCISPSHYNSTLSHFCSRLLFYFFFTFFLGFWAIFGEVFGSFLAVFGRFLGGFGEVFGRFWGGFSEEEKTYKK